MRRTASAGTRAPAATPAGPSCLLKNSEMWMPPWGRAAVAPPTRTASMPRARAASVPGDGPGIVVVGAAPRPARNSEMGMPVWAAGGGGGGGGGDDGEDRPTNPALLKGIDWGDDIRSPMLREVDRHQNGVEGIKRAPSQPPKDRLSHHAIGSTSRLRMCFGLTLAEHEAAGIVA